MDEWESDELVIWQAVEEIEEEYGAEELNELEGVVGWGERAVGPVVRMVTGDEADEYYWDGSAWVR